MFVATDPQREEPSIREIPYTVAPFDNGGYIAATGDGAFRAWGESEDDAEDDLEKAVKRCIPSFHLSRSDIQ